MSDSARPPASAAVKVTLEHRGDRPVLVGARCHIFEVNNALLFLRWRAYRMRLNLGEGAAVRFESGQSRTVELVSLDGDGEIWSAPV